LFKINKITRLASVLGSVHPFVGLGPAVVPSYPHIRFQSSVASTFVVGRISLASHRLKGRPFTSAAAVVGTCHRHLMRLELTPEITHHTLQPIVAFTIERSCPFHNLRSLK